MLSMGFKLLMKISLLLLVISASLLSVSCAGRQRIFTEKPLMEMSATQQEVARENLHHDTASDVHERLLRAYNTKDYGTYDPTPTLSKPPFKLIPN
ncbi:hypothetical protein AQUCO_00700284v1 [Aquilegia coerulea]|uniref:Uncharacterized protein n=1 Tax=Aquilegia coerulea TaxID=218851 RepID=A0A2G5EJA8_AQUCA|nr:hypothetical protein AQUCO_00700284v1 [Aquilegia coerulea]